MGFPTCAPFTVRIITVLVSIVSTAVAIVIIIEKDGQRLMLAAVTAAMV